MKPLISYYGGKQRMAPKIVPLIPRHTVYVEPFAGGLAVFFAKPWPGVTHDNTYREVINDKDEQLINLYRVIQDETLGPKLCARLDATACSKAEYTKAAGILKNSIGVPVIDLAWAYYVNIQQSFGYKLNGGWRRSRLGANPAATWHRRDPWPFLDRLRSVYIECDDALKVIRQWDSPQTFFYCDPPYPGTEQGHYGGYTREDFQALVEALDGCKGSFLLSNYCQGIEIPEGWERHEFAKTISVSVNMTKATGARTEILWRRQAKEEPRAEIVKLYRSGKYDCFTGDPEPSLNLGV